jgi:hypothetical protein
MRTTVTLDADVELLVKQMMRDRGMTFKQAVNDAIRAGMVPRSGSARPTFPTYDMGAPLVDVTKALRLAGELEDRELTGRLGRGA